MQPNQKIHENYEPNKTYPILVRLGGGHRIVEMEGWKVNDHNRRVRMSLFSHGGGDTHK
jgi:hypothetical protein